MQMVIAQVLMNEGHSVSPTQDVSLGRILSWVGGSCWSLMLHKVNSGGRATQCAAHTYLKVKTGFVRLALLHQPPTPVSYPTSLLIDTEESGLDHFRLEFETSLRSEIPGLEAFTLRFPDPIEPRHISLPPSLSDVIVERDRAQLMPLNQTCPIKQQANANRISLRDQ